MPQPDPKPEGFLAKLFDFSFNSFVATDLIRGLFAFLIVLGAGGVILAIGAAFQQGPAINGVFALLLGIPVYLVYLILARVYCELLIALFVIAEDIEDIRRDIARIAPQPPPSQVSSPEGATP